MIDWPQNNINPDQCAQLAKVLEQLDSSQKIWLSGYLAGNSLATASFSEQVTETAAVKNHKAKKLTILYGSQTGNGESVAKNLKSLATEAGLLTEIFSLADISVKQLVKKSLITLVISTHGEGEAPDDADIFYEQLFKKNAPDLTGLQYSVLALGDSSYEYYCQTGKDIDHRLNELGAKRIHERVDCDVDFEPASGQWIDDILVKVEDVIKPSPQDLGNITTLPIQNTESLCVSNKSNPYEAEILTKQKLTGRGSDKNTYHIELAIDPTQVQYQPGDSVAVIADNNPNAVERLLKHWKLQGNEVVTFKQHTKNIKALLTEHIEITQISKPFVKFLSEQIENIELQNLANSHEAFNAYCEQKQLVNLLNEFDPGQKIDVKKSLGHLRAITPRLYSIASSQSIYDDEVHLTINLSNATANGHYGLASGLLCDRAKVGDKVKIYVEPNKHFKLPKNPTTPIILIGPGTGVAPFRAFLQERKEQQASGENWLFFGNPHFATDFLYQTEWLKLQQQGVLNEIDVAFSRDQTHKIYVQDKLKDKSQLIWSWIENDASIYLCGDANHMAKDVEQTLIDIISQHGNLSFGDAKTYLKKLKRTHKYQKDVY
ncbi:sulfite reductase (NADPH) alpha subunit [Marinicella litoralis]|uniref:Sulfite reductase [NADPH] flavoprotein alpha-component n=2 Tax=Marinicella litoralis TaxID=644220 RepID=A0A4R6XKI0_9GAMM|nr:sulfite reductase (NADPH) alpha subunit [Marinicella litoralis]